MNSLNIISARVSPPPTPNPSRSNSLGNILSSAVIESRRNSRGTLPSEKAEGENRDTPDAQKENGDAYENTAHEETPLLEKVENEFASPEPSEWHIVRRISRTLLDSIRWVLSTLAAPGVYIIAFLYDESGNFAPLSQIRRLGTVFQDSSRRASTHAALEVSSTEDNGLFVHNRNGKGATGRRESAQSPLSGGPNTSSYAVSSESESEPDGTVDEAEQPTPGGSTRNARSKSQQHSDDNTPSRRSIRIKLNNDDSLRQRKQRKSQPPNTQSNGSGGLSPPEISPAALKSPTSPASSLSLTKYPRAPAPPRPLIPRRQPSYALPDTPLGRLTQKTLILDLDETLIHSMAKGGRMSTGHMVEVKLNTLVGAGGTTSLGPQHPILYYVHKRPHCDDFLRRVSYLPATQTPFAYHF
jgi:CTD nuclear envelope phosphatase 1